ncbi:dus [Symbiodinium natans]|uniref:Dus protein n=1 Tax=Symbiodinium natans TaxID=878477 RepID=A0A812IEK7_9DINO|nr:dus [Symbiodinium natans]
MTTCGRSQLTAVLGGWPLPAQLHAPELAEPAPSFSSEPQASVFRLPPGLELPRERIEGAEIPWIGSHGHPEACSRPCVHIQKFGGCPAGDACRYCHLPHTGKKSRKPDKRAREELSYMTDQELLTMCLPYIRKKAAQLDLPAAHLVVELLEAELASLAPLTHLRSRRDLKQVMSGMSFLHVVTISMSQLPWQVEAALLALKLQMPPSHGEVPLVPVAPASIML